MGNIKIVKGVFDTKLELEHAEVVAEFPDITVDYSHETLDFNRDYIKHPETSFYGGGFLLSPTKGTKFLSHYKSTSYKVS